MSSFVDECGINVCAGDGGAGVVSFRREAHVSRGGPDGGDGGDGGNIWIEADHNVASLLAFRDHPHRRAKNGTHGSGAKRHGKSSEELIIKVPEGTTIYELEGDQVLADLSQDGDRWLAARGGRGGRGNARFLSNKRRAPTFAEQGEEGEEKWLRMELRLLADVALVGFPNSGKSTFISKISAAKPRIADYPFTTLEPNLGVVQTPGVPEFTVADIPGLIEGASQGKGLGHQFLRHIERASILLILLDLSQTSEFSPERQKEVLENELSSYRPELLSRPRLVVGSRSDMSLEDSKFDGQEISSITGVGVKEVLYEIAGLIEEVRSNKPVNPTRILHQPEPEGIKVERVGDTQWEIMDRELIRIANLNDLSNPDALVYLQDRFKNMGVDRALIRAKVKKGEIVKIGKLEFEYDDDE
ncbi:MAG: GTPase ObgE [Acidimicrobiales bacterium]|jgi:GTP-binding protein|nr:GTPase ObgE [Acidimicrobiaceae bacterium]MDP6162402.1 GTPase ObgE [Acidimicrobiales bacterium]MDP6284813.1 GTPase ObgE [Acidimicrobiales bacterium]HJL90714.1 GTPase ObgE [Acidimicrobiales bacterium]HJO41375.1 GTPase ObgE [Acidimicrobiales bacterium]|tara:strand:- start:5 stop:1249 length:1245 start_codon:yes stop_codon:yes gene_type:complete